jgi:hypothetical protein
MSGQSDNVVRLGCAEQATIAEELRQYWQHVVDEGVPEHLRGLVLRFAGAVDSEVILFADFRTGDSEHSA